MIDHSNSPFLVDSEISKQEKASGGRLALGGTFGMYHGAVAGKKGRKLRAMGNQLVGTVGGGMAGQVAGGLLTRRTAGAMAGGAAGSIGGAMAGTARAQRKGHFKKES